MARRLLFLMLILSMMLILPSLAAAQMDADDDDDDDDDNDDNDDNDDDDNDNDDNDDDDNDDDNDDDDNDDNDTMGELSASLEFYYGEDDGGNQAPTPTELAPGEEYEFWFEVTNLEESLGEPEEGEWIYKVELSMPSLDYEVDTDEDADDPVPVPDPLHPDEVAYWESDFAPGTNTITWQSIGVISTGPPIGDIHEGEMLVFQFIATTDDANGEASDGFPWKLYSDDNTMAEGMAFINEPSDDDDDDDNDTGDDDVTGDDDDSGGGCGC